MAIEAEIGPLKYVASLVEDWGGPKVESGTAVRLIILIIMIVFDPLAILLLLASQISFTKISKNSDSTYNKLYTKIFTDESLPENPNARKGTARVGKEVEAIVLEEDDEENFDVNVAPGK